MVNEELAQNVKEFQEMYVCLKAGLGYIKFDFDKKDDLEGARKTAAAAMELDTEGGAAGGEETIEVSLQ